jgi:hypothetical protein
MSFHFLLICLISAVKFPFSGPLGTVSELLFEKKGLVPALQQIMVSL